MSNPILKQGDRIEYAFIGGGSGSPLRGTVVFADSKGVLYEPDAGCGVRKYRTFDEFHSIAPEVPRVGDRVRSDLGRGGVRQGTVVGVDGLVLWVRLDDDLTSTYHTDYIGSFKVIR